MFFSWRLHFPSDSVCCVPLVIPLEYPPGLSVRFPPGQDLAGQMQVSAAWVSVSELFPLCPSSYSMETLIGSSSLHPQIHIQTRIDALKVSIFLH